MDSYVLFRQTTSFLQPLNRQAMETQKKKIDKKDLPPTEKTRKPQDRQRKTNWQTNPEDSNKSRWNPCALYF
jgi:hypothetical protein